MSTRSVGSVSPDGVLMLACTEAIRDSQADQQYFLGRLDAYNSVSDSLSRYLRTLGDKSQQLSVLTRNMGADDARKTTVAVTTEGFDLAVGASGRVPSKTSSQLLGRDGLDTELRNVESTQETLRNRRQAEATGFQGADQGSQQLFTLLSSVLKSLHDAASGLVRNVA